MSAVQSKPPTNGATLSATPVPGSLLAQVAANIPPSLQNLPSLVQVDRMARGSLIADWAKVNAIKQKFDMESAMLTAMLPNGQFGTIPYGNVTNVMVSPAVQQDQTSSQMPQVPPPVPSPVPQPATGPLPIPIQQPESPPSQTQSVGGLPSWAVAGLGLLGGSSLLGGGMLLNNFLSKRDTTNLPAVVQPAQPPGPIRVPVTLDWKLNPGGNATQEQNATINAKKGNQ